MINLMVERPRLRWLAVGVAALVVAVAVCALAGLPPALPLVLALLAAVASRPVPGMAYALTVFTVPAGLGLLGVEAFVGAAFGGRDYALGLSAAVVVGVLFLLAARHWLATHWKPVAAAAAVIAVWALIGIAHHGAAQTLVGVRLIVLPVLVAGVLLALDAPRLARLLDVLAWLVVANAVAAVAEVVVGPARLVAWDLDRHLSIRYIGETFRVPGLTTVNAELGMLAGAYLLGYAALWLSTVATPRRWVWHAGAGAAVVCLGLSTSRSGAVLVAAGVLAGVLLNRSGGPVLRRRLRVAGLAAVGLMIAGFAVLGATGAGSLFQRFDVWTDLLRAGVPPWGLGIGAVGAATTSRVASGTQVYVDNYYVSLAVQLGPVAAVALVALAAYALVRLWRRAGSQPALLAPVTVGCGLAAAFLLIEGWEYVGAMAALALFVAYPTRC